MRLAALLLAAGGSRRMGSPKLLLPWHSVTVIGQSLLNLLAAPVCGVTVVTGSNPDAVEAACHAVSPAQPFPPVQFVHNPHWQQGMFTSIQVGLGALSTDVDGFFVALGDMPLVPPGVCSNLSEQLTQHPGAILVPCYQGQRGHPVLFPAELIPYIEGPPDDVGLRMLLQRFPERVITVEVGNPGVIIDLDTSEQYAEYAPHPK